MARRGRDLAGLAALGALGFMAGKGLYKRPGEQLAPVEDRVPVPVAVSPSPDADFPQAGSTLAPDDTSDFLSRRLRGINEVGQATSMENIAPMEKPPAPRVATSRAAAASDEVARGRGMNRAPTPAVIGPRSTGAGGFTAEELEREQEYRRMRTKADALAKSGTPYGAQTDASALTYHRTGVRPSTVKGGLGTATGMKAGDIEAWERQQEDLKKLGRGYKTQYKKGGAVKAKPKKMASGGMSSASKRADGIATKGKTKCKMY